MKKQTPNKTINIDKHTIGIKIGSKIAMVDKEDYHLVSDYHWHMHNHGYAVANIVRNGKRTSALMHTMILPAPKGLEVDHKNGNKLDNRQNTGNLRLLSRGENLLNKAGWSKCGYKGAYKYKVSGHTYWLSKIAGKHLGSFKTKLEAALAYDLAAMLCFPDVCVTNFKY